MHKHICNSVVLSIESITIEFKGLINYLMKSIKSFI